MGLLLFSDSKPETITPNPNPYNFTIEDAEQFGKFTVLGVKYPDCTTFEGKKLLLYYGTTIEALRAQLSLDPHFMQRPGYLTPIARFEPTKRGAALLGHLMRVSQYIRDGELKE